MTLQEFISKYKGKSIDWDGAYGGQCVDLFRQYLNEILGISQPKAVNGAADFWSNYDTDSVLNQNFTKIANSPEFVPQEGDVAIWNRRMGNGFGHIAICTGKGDLNTFESFDQNWSRVSYCELVTHPYTNFYGVLRFNKKIVDTMYRGYDTTNLESNKVCIDDHIRVVEGQLIDKTQYESVKGQLTEVTKQNESLSDELGSARASISAMVTKIEAQNEIIRKFSDEDAVQIKELRDSYEEATKYRKAYTGLLEWVREGLKLPKSYSDSEEAENEAYVALGKLNSSKQKELTFEDYKYIIKIGEILWQRKS